MKALKPHHTLEREAAFFIVLRWLPWTPDHESPRVCCHQAPIPPTPPLHPPTLPINPPKQSALALNGPTGLGLYFSGTAWPMQTKLLLEEKQQKAIKSQLGWSFQSWWRGSKAGKLLLFMSTVLIYPFLITMMKKQAGYTLVSLVSGCLTVRKLTREEESERAWWHHWHDSVNN